MITITSTANGSEATASIDADSGCVNSVSTTRITYPSCQLKSIEGALRQTAEAILARPENGESGSGVSTHIPMQMVRMPATRSMHTAPAACVHKTAVSPTVIGGDLHKKNEYNDVDSVNHLLHELRVHQVELELQNEELRESQRRLLAANEDLKSSQESFYQLYHDAPVGYVTLDAKGLVLQANAHVAEMCSRQLRNIEGRHFIELLDPLDHPQFRRRFPAFFRSPQGKSMELHLRSTEGQVRYILLSGRVPHLRLTNAQDHKRHHRVTNFSLTDITERKRMQDHLERERTRLRDIIAGTSEGFWLLDGNLQIIQVNAALCSMLGYSSEEIIGKQPWDFTNADNADIFYRQLSKLQTAQHCTDEVELHTKDGRCIHTLFNASTLHATTYINEGGTGSQCAYDSGVLHIHNGGVFSFITNITERKHHEARMIEARQMAEAANRAKSAFLANISHELRTPLNAIMGYTSIIAQDHLLQPSHLQAIDVINHSARNLLRLINEVLDLTDLESGGLKLQYQECHLLVLLRQLFGNHQRLAADKGLSLELIANPLPTKIITDEVRLVQILENLLENAIKFTQQGRITTVIEAKSKSPSQTTLQFCVVDQGPGIPASLLPAVVQPFRRISDNQYQDGTGLGLSLCHALITHMGGAFGILSKVADGQCAGAYPPLATISIQPQGTMVWFNIDFAIPIGTTWENVTTRTGVVTKLAALTNAPSASIMANLRYLDELGDIEGLLTKAEQLRCDYPNFAQQLRTLVETMQLDELAAWLAQQQCIATTTVT